MHIISLFFTIFADRMNKGHKQTISTRVISTAFIVLAIAIFKPFSLEVWEWQAYVHLLLLFVLGIFSCFLTEVILRFLVRMPRSYDRGVSYIISRNPRFQFINTPLVALLICLYRHFLLSSLAEENKFSLGNFLETLLIIGFLSFAIGLYWRFKFRSKYLAAELEEIREMNEKLKTSTPKPTPNPSRTEGEVGYSQAQNLSELPSCSGGAGGGLTLRGTTNDSVTLQISCLLYIEAVGNYVKICHLRDDQVHTDMLRATSKQMEETLAAYPMIVRCHRAFLVNLSQVEQIVSHSGSTQLVMKHSHDAVPVSRSNMTQIRAAIKDLL